MRYLIAISLLILCGITFAANSQVVTIQIKSRPAASMVDAVRPILGQDGSVSAFHDKLIVKGTPEQITAVRAMLRQIDRPARRLIIEVRQAGQLSQSSRDFGYGVSTGDVRIGRVPPGSDAQVRYQDIRTRGSGDSLQRVQALDGRPALIRAGQSVPVYQAQQYVGPWGVSQGYEVQYRDATSGFYALPRVHGNQVTVEIYQQTERPVDSGRFNIQQASSMLRGNLGQWMTLGSVGGESGDSRNQIGRALPDPSCPGHAARTSGRSCRLNPPSSVRLQATWRLRDSPSSSRGVCAPALQQLHPIGLEPLYCHDDTGRIQSPKKLPDRLVSR